MMNDGWPAVQVLRQESCRCPNWAMDDGVADLFVPSISNILARAGRGGQAGYRVHT